MTHVSTWIWFIGIPVVFVLILLYVFRPGAKRRYRSDAQIPFRDDDNDKR